MIHSLTIIEPQAYHVYEAQTPKGTNVDEARMVLTFIEPQDHYKRGQRETKPMHQNYSPHHVSNDGLQRGEYDKVRDTT